MNTNFDKEAFLTDILTLICTKVDLPAEEIPFDVSFSRLGLDSAGHVQLSAIIEDHINDDVSPTIAFDYPTIHSLISYIDRKTTYLVAEEAY